VDLGDDRAKFLHLAFMWGTKCLVEDGIDKTQSNPL
jgi:hypothetical protein